MHVRTYGRTFETGFIRSTLTMSTLVYYSAIQKPSDALILRRKAANLTVSVRVIAIKMLFMKGFFAINHASKY